MNLSEKEVKVKRFKCKCGKTIMLSVIDGENEKSKDVKKAWARLAAKGLDSDTITLEEARNSELCFDCKL